MPKVKMMAGIDAAISLPNARAKEKKGAKKQFYLHMSEKSSNFAAKLEKHKI